MSRFPLLPVRAPGEAEAIPERLHLIWVGSPPPHWVRASYVRWVAALSGYDVRLWTDESMLGTPLGAVRAYAATFPDGTRRSLRGVSDVLRVYAMGWYGGWYFDVDCVLLRPLPKDRPAMVYSAGKKDTLGGSNGACGFTRGHPFLSQVATLAQQAEESGATNDHFTWGPRTHRKAQQNHPSIPVAWGLPMVQTKEIRRAQAQGTLSLAHLAQMRERYPEATVAHVGLEGET